MPHKVLKLLADILKAGNAIQSFTQGKTFADYENNLMMRSAVERQFEIIGEAVKRLEQENEHAATRITGRRLIIDFRNLIAHGYDSVDNTIVWQAVLEKLPPLLAETRALMKEIGG